MAKRVFYYAGNYPHLCDYYVAYDSIKDNDLIIKYRPPKKSYVNQLFEEIQDLDKEQYIYNYLNNSDYDNENKKVKRIKERTIKDVIEKVSIWRKLYSGTHN